MSDLTTVPQATDNQTPGSGAAGVATLTPTTRRAAAAKAEAQRGG